MADRDLIATPSDTEPDRASGAWIKRNAGYLLAIAGSAWVLHDVHVADVWERLAVPHWGWVVLAVLADIASYVGQGLRWRLFLAPVGELSLKKGTQAIYAGLFVNEIVPMRFGEAVRAYLAARWLSLRFADVIASMVFERFADGVWLLFSIGAVALFVPLPENMVKGAGVLGIGLFAGMALLACFAYFGRAAKSSFAGRAAAAIHHAAASRKFWLAFFASLLIPASQALAFWFAMKGYGLQLAFWASIAVFLIVRLGTAIPNSPANAGTFQFFTVAGLIFFGIDKATATAFSIAVFLILTVPLWTIGFFALTETGLTIRRLRLELGQQMSAFRAGTG